MGCVCECSEADPGRRRRARMIEVVAFSSFLIMVGALELVPGRRWPHYALGAGIILLSKNLARHSSGMKIRPLSLILGGGALATGLVGSVVPSLPLLPVFLLAAGVTGLGVVALGLPNTERGAP